jgi:hypothetical protein
LGVYFSQTGCIAAANSARLTSSMYVVPPLMVISFDA